MLVYADQSIMKSYIIIIAVTVSFSDRINLKRAGNKIIIMSNSKLTLVTNTHTHTKVISY